MRSFLTKVGLALALTLTTAFSSNLEPLQAQNDTNKQEGYYYLPPHQLKTWYELTPQQQKKAKELNFDRDAFAKWVSEQPGTPTWAEAMGYTQPKKIEQNETNSTNTKK